MVGKFDILIFGGLALFLISQKEKIASGISGAGGFFGEAFASAGEEFTKAFGDIGIEGPTGPPSETPTQPAPGEPSPSPFESCNCCTTQSSKNLCENTLGLIGCSCEKQSEPTCGPGTFEDPVDGKCKPLSDLIPSFPTIPEASAEIPPEQQGPIQPIPESRPTTIQDIIDQQETQPIQTAEQKNILSQGLESEIPTDQTFGFGGPSFIGGTIRENPVDTLSEVLDLFPELTASQASDFLNQFSGISPSDALRIDPDVSNITAAIDGENVKVENVTVSDLEQEEIKASCTTCQLFGLNCEKCQVARLQNA